MKLEKERGELKIKKQLSITLWLITVYIQWRSQKKNGRGQREWRWNFISIIHQRKKQNVFIGNRWITELIYASELGGEVAVAVVVVVVSSSRGGGGAVSMIGVACEVCICQSVVVYIWRTYGLQVANNKWGQASCRMMYIYPMLFLFWMSSSSSSSESAVF